MIAVIDYGAGNLKSVSKALEFLKAKCIVTSRIEDIKKADKIILPGVGNFGDAVKSLKQLGIFGAIKKEIRRGKPYLGICLGLQLLFEKSEESKKNEGLGIFKGNVVKFKANKKIPQIGWNKLKIKKKSKLFNGLKEGHVYFVHSYYVKPKDKKIILTTTNYGGEEFVSGIEKGNIFAFQFHPEKSGTYGLKILKNFVSLK